MCWAHFSVHKFLSFSKATEEPGPPSSPRSEENLAGYFEANYSGIGDVENYTFVEFLRFALLFRRFLWSFTANNVIDGFFHPRDSELLSVSPIFPVQISTIGSSVKKRHVRVTKEVGLLKEVSLPEKSFVQ